MATLFLMPAMFILIMSLAFENFTDRQEARLSYAVLDLDGTPTSLDFSTLLSDVESLKKSTPPSDEADARLQIRNGKTAFVVVITKGFEQQMGEKDGTPSLRFLIDPAVPSMVRSGFRHYVEASATRAWLKYSLERFGRLNRLPWLSEATKNVGTPKTIIEPIGARDNEAIPAIEPSAVQQNVPAWLIFSMFFVSIPISMVFVGERLNGTLHRLRSQRVSYSLVLAGKFMPFVLINQVQAVVMVAVGRWLVPLIGGDALILPANADAIAGLLTMSLAVSVAAVGWALFIASAARSSEQATVFGSGSSILMGAIGGVMVPRFLMPASMQSMTSISPMGWALDGFHSIMLRHGGLIDVLPTACALVGFGLVSLATAFFFNHRATST